MVEEIWLPPIDKELCTGYGDCVVACPTDALGLVDGLAILVEPAACSYCGGCDTACPVDAIALPYQVVLESDL